MAKPLTHAQQKQLAMQWKNAAPALRAQRHKDIRQRDNAKAILSLDRLSREIVRKSPPRATSGLVEMYRVLMRNKKG
jgi:hypothetical protein